MARILLLLKLAGATLGFGVYVWIEAVLATPRVKRRKLRRRRRRRERSAVS